MNQSNVIAVFDTNELVRLALKKTSAIKRLEQAIRGGKFRLVFSQEIATELERVLNYPRIKDKNRLTESSIQNFLNELLDVGLLADDLYEVSRVEQDATDNVFLACSLETQADYLVSEDPHLRNIKYFYGTQIIGLNDFQKILGI